MALSDNAKGALLMVASMAAFTFNDTLMKSLAGDVPLPQAIFLRGIMTTLLLGGLAYALGQLRLRLSGEDLWLTLFRTLAEIAAVFLFLTALFNMPIANATAIPQVLPLAITLAGALFLGEAIGWRRLAAIGVGFVGVLLIVRPGTDGFTIYSLYVLGAVIAVTLRDLAVRRMSNALSSLTVAFYGALGVTFCAGLASLAQPWEPVSLPSGALLCGAALFILAAYILSVMVMRVGEIAMVSPFRYSAIVIALAVGYVVFDERPETPMLIGAALVVSTGVYTLWREQVAAKRAGRKPVVDTPCDSH